VAKTVISDFDGSEIKLNFGIARRFKHRNTSTAAGRRIGSLIGFGFVEVLDSRKAIVISGLVKCQSLQPGQFSRPGRAPRPGQGLDQAIASTSSRRGDHPAAGGRQAGAIGRHGVPIVSPVFMVFGYFVAHDMDVGFGPAAAAR
jgi:hypothetical protein